MKSGCAEYLSKARTHNVRNELDLAFDALANAIEEINRCKVDLENPPIYETFFADKIKTNLKVLTLHDLKKSVDTACLSSEYAHMFYDYRGGEDKDSFMLGDFEIRRRK